MATKKTTIPKAVAETFELRPSLKAVYLSKDGKAWFFDERTAKKHFGEDYSCIENPITAKQYSDGE